MMQDRQTYKQQARILRALANETRLLLIDRLSKGECRVSELVRLAGVDQSTVSKHLAVLRGVGVVDDERRGNAVFYHLVTPCVMDFFACSSRVLGSRG